MAVTKWYFTATGADTDQTADNEVELDQTAPGSGTLSASIASNSEESAFLGTTNAAPHDDNDWTALTRTDAQISIDVNETDADLTLTARAGTPQNWRRFNSSLTQQEDWVGVLDAWDSNSGTGVKVLTTEVAVNLGTASASDLLGGLVGVENSGHMDAQTIQINLGSSTYVEAPWPAPGGPTDQPYRDHFIQLLSQ